MIKLNFLDQVTLSFKMRKPTTEELHVSLKIYWMINKIPDKHSQILQPTHGRTVSIIPEPLPWEKRLGSCSELLLVKTLEATTQLCKTPT
jgi:hypothetical protein